MTTIHITRNPGPYGAMRAMTILAGHETGGPQALARIRSGETVSVNVPDDAAQVYAKMDWGRTVNVIPRAQIVQDAQFDLDVWFTLNPLKMLGLPNIPARFVPRG